MSKHNFLDLTGQKFGRWAAIERAPNVGQKTMWHVQCDCGTLRIVPGGDLRNGKTKSCGCLNREMITARNLRHGMNIRGKRTRTYRIWCAMRTRCENAKAKDFARYGGRGIAVCSQWHNFSVFLADMGECPPYLTLERRDNNGHYEPENCYWATRKEQSNNKCNTKRMIYRGETITLAQWTERTGLSYSCFYRRTRTLGWNEEKTLNTPRLREKKKPSNIM